MGAGGPVGCVYLVSRHPGALAWLLAEIGSVPTTVLTHLDDVSFTNQDTVCGVLPLHWAARVCAAGARLFVLTVAVPRDLRGRELSAEQLQTLGARLIQYQVRAVKQTAPRREHDACKGA